MTAHQPSLCSAIKERLTPPCIVPITILLAVLLFHLIHGPIIPGPM